MAVLKIKKSSLKGSLSIPPSKSHTMRALIFGSLGQGKTTIYHYLKSPDTMAMIQALRQFGIQIDVQSDKIEIEGNDGQLQPCENIIDAGNSGQVLRFIGSLAALLPSYTVITGDPSIRYHRPVQPLLSALNQLNASAHSTRLNGMAPIIIKGPMQPGHAELDGEDSQPVSGLLIATSFLEGTSHLKVKNPGEKPWIDFTLSWLHKLGGEVTHKDYTDYTITGPLRYPGFEMTIPGDFSSAAFPIVAALITQSTITLKNMDLKESQGDKKLITILQQMGAHFSTNEPNQTVTIYPAQQLNGIYIDANDIIDAIPILAVLGCYTSGTTEITNAAIARKKESDRIHAIATELQKMGGSLVEKEDGLIIQPAPLHGASLFSHVDHRIVMALAVASLGASGTSTIEGIECIAKSYPSFAADFKQIGAQIEVQA